MEMMDFKKDRLSVDKVWLKNYPPGVPAEINPDAYQSIIDVFDKTFKKFANFPAFYNFGTTLTYSQIDEYSRLVTAYLQEKLQIEKGERVAIMLPNVLQYPIVLIGALRAGAIVVNVNPLYTADELVYQLNNAGASTLIVLANFAHTIEAALPRMPYLKNVIITNIGDMLSPIKAFSMHVALKYFYKKIPDWNLPSAISFKEMLKAAKHMKVHPIEIHNHDIAFLQYTGGTTGVSKGAILTHRNIIANIQQAGAWFKELVIEGKDIIITALPLYHIFSLTANCLFFSSIGGLNVLITNPRDLSSIIKEMKRFNVSIFTGVNTLFNGLLKHPPFCRLNFSRLRLSLGGGMSVQRVVAEKWQTITGKPIVEAYGLTETSPCVTINPANSTTYNGSIGLPVSSTLVTILDEDHHALPLGEAGEIAVKGPQVMQGYWQNPDETQKVFTRDGWLLTGDIGTMDEFGYVRILERKKDMILVSGFNVYPNEIENVIARIPGVKEVAVIGVPDENTGEAARAYIVKDDSDLTPETVIKSARAHLTPYKVPKQIEFVEELPKSNVGKILRRALREKGRRPQEGSPG